ncbi:hypothetical protein [Paenibacillus taichungensis]
MAGNGIILILSVVGLGLSFVIFILLLSTKKRERRMNALIEYKMTTIQFIAASLSKGDRVDGGES